MYVYVLWESPWRVPPFVVASNVTTTGGYSPFIILISDVTDVVNSASVDTKELMRVSQPGQ